MLKYDKAAAQNIERSYNTPDIARQRLQTLNALALNMGERVVDVGCGTGFLINEMAAMVGSSGSLTGIDFSQDMLDVAVQRCESLPQVKLRQGSAVDLPLDDASFDAATCTQTLLYVPDVDQSIAELARVLKVGGRLAIVETDWNGAIVNNADPEMTQKIFQSFQKPVPNPNLPVKLSPMLRKHGFGAIKVEAVPIINTGYTSANFSPSVVKWAADMAVLEKEISRQEADAWMADLEAKAESGEYFFCVNRFLFSAVRVK
jgi:ubiquinone/menaquinone biosynthesis C-methylase UbiE